MKELKVEDLKKNKNIRFGIEVPYDMNNKSYNGMEKMIKESPILKTIYNELTKEEIELIFLGLTNYKTSIKASDVLDIVVDMGEFVIDDNSVQPVDKNQHHGKKAKADINKERELKIKDIEGPSISGVAGVGSNR